MVILGRLVISSFISPSMTKSAFITNEAFLTKIKYLIHDVNRLNTYLYKVLIPEKISMEIALGQIRGKLFSYLRCLARKFEEKEFD